MRKLEEYVKLVPDKLEGIVEKRRVFMQTLSNEDYPALVSSYETSTSRSIILKTLEGHFSAQVPQELHFEKSTTGI